jgi:hypothetical protein
MTKTHDRECNSKSHQFQWPAWVYNNGIGIRNNAMKTKLTQERLKEVLDYDPSTGLFVWKITRPGRGCRIGNTAGGLNPLGVSFDYGRWTQRNGSPFGFFVDGRILP